MWIQKLPFPVYLNVDKSDNVMKCMVTCTVQHGHSGQLHSFDVASNSYVVAKKGKNVSDTKHNRGEKSE